jgi:hypothetical protein
VVELAIIHFMKLHFNGGFKYPKDKKWISPSHLTLIMK